jgi:Interferon-induced transmembrane protein
MSQNWTPPPAAGGGSATVPNNLVIAIISVFCCWPLAIVAIISATQVNAKLAAGDVAGAQEASAKAKKFSYIAIGIGVAVYVIIGLIYGVAIIAALSSK